METPHYQRLEQLMEARRLDLDMTWDDVALTAKVSVATLRAIRRGETAPRARTKRRIENALRWATGSYDAIVAGREPTPLETREVALGDSAKAVEELTVEREPTAREIADRMTELANAIKAEREQERLEYEDRIRRLEEEVERLRDRKSG